MIVLTTCDKCGGKLIPHTGGYRCGACGQNYNVYGGAA